LELGDSSLYYGEDMTILAEIITLNPGESQSVDFQIIPQEAGIYNVDVDGLPQYGAPVDSEPLDVNLMPLCPPLV